MLKSTVLIAVAVAVIACAHAEPEPPVETTIQHHHYHSSTQQHGKQHGSHSHHGQQQVKIRQSGPSKIFGWLGSRFAKIPHYLPRFPQFPKYIPPQKLPQYQAIILPDPPKVAGHGKVKSPEKVKITPVYEESQVTTYHEVASIPEMYTNSYTPVPISANSYSVPESAPQIEVVPSTLVYSDKQIISPPQQASTPVVTYRPLAPAPIAAPPLQYTQYASINSIPAPARKPAIFQASAYKQQQQPQGTVPIVPQSTGPDYFDTAYRSANEQQILQSVSNQVKAQQKQFQQQGVGFAETKYGANFEQIEAQAVPQVYDSSVDLAAIGGPVISSTAQQATYSLAPAPVPAPAAAQPAYSQIQDYANQALTNQALSSFTASLADSGVINPEQNIYAQYSQLSPAVATQDQRPQQKQQQQQQYVYQQQAQPSNSNFEKTDIPGVQILSQGTDGGNPVFEVLADANAPDYNGHPFDINKLISMIEPGAQLESAELSHAASETKTTYLAPMSAQTSSSSTSGINDLILSESDPSPSVTQVNGSSVSPYPASSSLPPNFNVKSKFNNSSNSSLKEIMDFFQQTGGKGYIVVEKKRHRSDNLTLDSDQTRDDDLTNGPTRVNITSDSIFPQLELLHSHEQTNNSHTDTINNIPTDLLFPLENHKYEEYETQDNEDYDHDDDVDGSDKLKNSFSYNQIQLSSDKGQRTVQTTVASTIPVVSVAESSIGNSTTTVRPIYVPVTVAAQLTTLFEPVTPGKPVIYATTPQPLALNGSTLNPNHNYNSNPDSKNFPLSPNYSSFSSLPVSEPTLNTFLDAVDESLLDDDPIETEGDLNASESQQVRSIAITVTPPPRLLSSTKPTVSKLSKSLKEVPSTSTSSPKLTTTESPTVTVSPAFLVPATKKPSSSGASKGRPAPVYRGKKANPETAV